MAVIAAPVSSSNGRDLPPILTWRVKLPGLSLDCRGKDIWVTAPESRVGEEGGF